MCSFYFVGYKLVTGASHANTSFSAQESATSPGRGQSSAGSPSTPRSFLEIRGYKAKYLGVILQVIMRAGGQCRVNGWSGLPTSFMGSSSSLSRRGGR